MVLGYLWCMLSTKLLFAPRLLCPTAAGVVLAGALLLPMAGVRGQALALTGVSPAANAAAGRYCPLALTFNQPLATGSQSALRVFSAQRGGLRTAAVSATANGNALVFSPQPYPFAPGETVQATLTTAAAGVGGALARPFVLQFTTAVAGTGRGSFVAMPEVAVAHDPGAVALGDLDGDGDLDVLTAHSSTNLVSVRFNNGAGAFAPGGTTLTLLGAPTALALGDVDGDGDLDLLAAGIGVVGLGSAVCVRLNNGAGGFAPPAGGGTVPVGSYASGLAVADLDGDGDLDLVATNAGPGTVSVRLNDGTGQFQAGAADPRVGATPFSIAAGDVDNDGDVDFVTTSRNDQVYVSLNTGGGAFTTRSGPSVGANSGAVLLADVDGDGDLDVLTLSYDTRAVCVRLNNGTGTFSAPATNPNPIVGERPAGMAVGDLDADGDLDLVVSSTGAVTATVLQNNGAGSFAPTGTPDLGPRPWALALGDLDGDGDLDAAVDGAPGAPPAPAGVVRACLNNGTGPLDLASVRVSGPVAVCAGAGGVLVAAGTPTPLGYRWNTGATTPNLAVSQPGVYTVTASFAGCQTATARHEVFAAAPVPAFTLGPDTVLCAGGEVVLQAPTGAGFSHRWSDGSGAPTLRVSGPGTYAVVVTSNCGSQTARRQVAYRSCANTAVLPNVVTPNGDGHNDWFAPAGLPPGPWALVVYTRWGQEVYRAAAYHNKWGEGVPAGTYFYRMEHPGTGATFRGWVEVIR